MTRPKTIRKEVVYPHPILSVWTALTDARAMAEWLMPNDFELAVGKRFQFRVDPMLSFEGIVDCEVLEVDPPRRLVYTWRTRLRGRSPAEPMTLTWTLESVDGGTRLILDQSGLETLPAWWRFSMKTGWGRMLKTLLPKVLTHVADDGQFTPGAIVKRDYGVKTVPDGFAK